MDVVRISQDIRTNLTITDRQGLTVKLNEAGPPLKESELEKIEAAVAASLEKAGWLMLCGSVPPGVPPDFYGKLIRLAQERRVKTMLDTDGEALARGVEAGPTVVKPNHQEAERLLGRALITRAHFVDAVTRIKAMGPESVLLSLGSRGAIAADGHRMVEALAPRTEAVSPIGAGDAMAAAYVWAVVKKKVFPDAVRWAVAEGTASAMLPGMDSAAMEQARAVYKSVEVRVE